MGLERIDPSTAVVVLKFVRGRLPHGPLTVVRSLGRLGVPVALVHDHERAAVARSRYLDRRRVWDGLSADPQATVDVLLALGREMGSAILIPVDDAATLFAAEHGYQLRAHYIFPDISPELTRQLANKKELHFLAERHGVPHPDAFFPEDIGEVREFVGNARFPIVAKSIDPGLLPSRPDTRSVVITRTPEELIDHYRRAEVPGQPNLMFQEYIPGGPDTVWMFNGYFDNESRCLFGATGQKLRQHLPYTGMTTLGIWRDNAAVRGSGESLMNGIGYRGAVDMGLRYDRRDGLYKILDVNPRVGATFRLFTSPEGMDVVRALYLDLTGQQVPSTSSDPGRKWLLETHDPMSSWIYHRDGALTFRDWYRSFRGVREKAFFARDDPIPAAVVYGIYAGRLLRRVGARIDRAVRK